MAATSSLLGGNNSPNLTRTIERVLEDAQVTCELILSGRKLKDYPKIASKYDLSDTTYADLSKNRLSELPEEVCRFSCLEKLNCYHNVIRILPDSVLYLQCLTYLNLSRNQLTTIPTVLCRLPLEVLLLNNNKLVSLPEEIGNLHMLMDLDISCNEISYLPPQIQNLESLKSLNMRRNLLQELQPGVSKLNLVRLDISGNKISVLPTSIRLIDSLMELILDHNPLTSPPAFLCTRGKVHIFKYLEIQAIKEDRNRGMSEAGYRKSFRKTSNHQPPNDVRFPNGLVPMPEIIGNNSKRYTVDSGYNTSDGGDCTRWSQELQDITNTLITNDSSVDDPRHLALRAAELTKEQRSERNKNRTNINGGHVRHNGVYSDHSGCSTPSTLSPGSEMNLELEFNRELERQRNLQLNEDRLDRLRREKQLECESNERRVVAVKVFEQQRENARKKTESNGDGKHVNGVSEKPVHIQTYREYKESLRQQRGAQDVYSTSISKHSPDYNHGGASPDPSSDSSYSSNQSKRPNSSLSVNQHVSRNIQEVDNKSETGCQPTTYSHQQTFVLKKMEDERSKVKKIQKEAVLSFVKQRTNSTESESSPTSPPTGALNGSNRIPLIKRSNSTKTPEPKKNDDFANKCVVKNKCTNVTSSNRSEAIDKAREDELHLQKLRSIIETRLKVELPDDLSCALGDGVVLCHLANNIRPRSVPSIHVPSPAVPKLTLAKCRRNVENFLNACRLIGVPEEEIYACDDVTRTLQPMMLCRTVCSLLKRQQQQQLTNNITEQQSCCENNNNDGPRQRPLVLADYLISYFCVTVLLSTCIFLYNFPPSS